MKFHIVLISLIVCSGCTTTHSAGRSMATDGSDAELAGPAADAMPIFDVHAHYHDSVKAVLNPENALDQLQSLNVTRSLLSSWVGDGTEELRSRAPHRILPSVAVYTYDSFAHPYDRLHWMDEENVPKLVRDRLKADHAHLYRAIGEVHLMLDIEPTPVMREIAQIASENHLAILAHSHHGTIEKWIKASDKNITFIWAHAGVTCRYIWDWCPKADQMSEEFAKPEDVKRMLGQYDNLYIDLSARDTGGRNIAYENGPNKGKLLPEWQDIILSYPDRVMLGTDSYIPLRWNNLEKIVGEMRGWLRGLPLEVAKKVAFENADKILGAE